MTKQASEQNQALFRQKKLHGMTLVIQLQHRQFPNHFDGIRFISDFNRFRLDSFIQQRICMLFFRASLSVIFINGQPNHHSSALMFMLYILNDDVSVLFFLAFTAMMVIVSIVFVCRLLNLSTIYDK